MLGILAVAIIAVGAFAVSRPVHRVGPASAGAPISADGYSRFTPNGHKYFTEHGEILIALDHAATELALPAYGASRFALVPPLDVRVIDGDVETLQEDVAQVLIFTHLDRVVTIKLTTAQGSESEFRSVND